MARLCFSRPPCLFLLFVAILLNKAQSRDLISFPDEVPPSLNHLHVSDSALNMVPSSADGGCKTTEGENGTCLPLEDCPELLSFIETRNGIHTPGTSDYIRKRICKFQARSAFVCCLKEKATAPVTFSPPGSLSLSSPTSLPSIIPSHDECGLSLRIKVTKGEEFNHGAHPWLVGVGYPKENEPFKVECGGTLITKKHVLTAAHCFYRELRGSRVPNYTHVILGEHSLSKDEKPNPIILKIAERKEIGYNHTIHYGDISLLVLEKEVTFTAFIRPACLPFGLKEEDIDFIKNEPLIAGWGRTYFGERTGRDIPLETGVAFVPKPECRKAYDFAPDVPLDDTQICFGNDGRDACRGDSGGPLLYRDTKKFKRVFVMGIVAFGVECGSPVYPGVYTYVPRYLEWITANL